mmetsp:Transcript_11341/g.40927  ORF Transcript_11341/g.40927 Transcript_11341/m.40927 type:complete len:242 (-) Transcript_11341:117-842(-)
MVQFVVQPGRHTLGVGIPTMVVNHQGGPVAHRNAAHALVKIFVDIFVMKGVGMCVQAALASETFLFLLPFLLSSLSFLLSLNPFRLPLLLSLSLLSFPLGLLDGVQASFEFVAARGHLRDVTFDVLQLQAKAVCDPVRLLTVDFFRAASGDGGDIFSLVVPFARVHPRVDKDGLHLLVCAVLSEHLSPAFAPRMLNDRAHAAGGVVHVDPGRAASPFSIAHDLRERDNPARLVVLNLLPHM